MSWKNGAGEVKVSMEVELMVSRLDCDVDCSSVEHGISERLTQDLFELKLGWC
jgi:hypothetical protein